MDRRLNIDIINVLITVIFPIGDKLFSPFFPFVLF